MTAKEKRALAVSYMRGRAKCNTYTNGGKRGYFFGYPEDGKPGYSDCSSACRAAIKRASGIDIGSNTDRQLRNGAGVIVDQTDGIYPDESRLQPGDCLYFKGNAAHVKSVGHVEMYTGDNECYGHGSGTGPTRKALKAYCRQRGTPEHRYFCAVRWIPDDEGEPEKAAATRVYVSAAGNWRIRAAPGPLGKTLAIVPQGTVLEHDGQLYSGALGKWAHVSRGGVAGWISGAAVKTVR